MTGGPPAAQANTDPGPPPARVRTQAVAAGKVAPTQEVIGLLSYDRTAKISTEVAGLVQKIQVKEGDLVRENAPLFSLNTDILDADIANHRARLEQTTLRITHAEKNFQRFQELFRKKNISEREYDASFYTWQDLVLEKQAVGDTLNKLLLTHKKSVVVAPFDGIVLEKEVEQGEWVQPGRQTLTIAATRELIVRAPVAENLIRYLPIGSKVAVSINAFDRQLQGTVSSVVPRADVTTKNLFVKISIPPQKDVAMNMSATVHIPAGPGREVNILPRAAVVTFQGKHFVYTINDGKATLAPVTISSYLGDQVGVTGPAVRPGMAVVIEGNERLRPDQPVTVVDGSH